MFVEDIDLEATNGVQSMMNHHPSPKLNTNKKIKYNPKPTLLGLYVDLCEEKTEKKNPSFSHCLSNTHISEDIAIQYVQSLLSCDDDWYIIPKLDTPTIIVPN